MPPETPTAENRPANLMLLAEPEEVMADNAAREARFPVDNSRISRGPIFGSRKIYVPG